MEEKTGQISIIYKILYEIYLQNKEITIKQIMTACNLKYEQVVRAINAIKPMCVLQWRYEERPAGYKQISRGKMFIKIKKERKDWLRKKLEEKGII